MTIFFFVKVLVPITTSEYGNDKNMIAIVVNRMVLCYYHYSYSYSYSYSYYSYQHTHMDCDYYCHYYYYYDYYYDSNSSK